MGGSCDKKGRRKNNNKEMCVDEIQLAERTNSTRKTKDAKKGSSGDGHEKTNGNNLY